jgi:hypothetical protein
MENSDSEELSEDVLISFAKDENIPKWAYKETNIPGVRIIKIPATKKRANNLVALVVNPIDGRGQPRMRRGVIISDDKTRKDIAEILENEDMKYLLNIIEQLNNKLTAKPRKIVVNRPKTSSE